MIKHTVSCEENEFSYELQRKNVKNINLRIRPDLTITVSANQNVPFKAIDDFVKEKAPWITKKLDYFKKFQPLENKKEYVSGESIRYLGRQYRLKVRESSDETVKYLRGFIYICVQDINDFNKKEELYKNWEIEKAELHFIESLDKMHKLVKNYDIPKPDLKIREMKTRWGSCHRKDKFILLNLKLIKAPKHCIDYVVLHELIHFKYKNHDDLFYTFLTLLMPDWEKRKQILDEEVAKNL